MQEFVCLYSISKIMKVFGKIPLFFVAALAWIVIISSCANVGMPTGGPKDSIPPVLINTQPGYKSLGFGGNEVRLTFNEYIVSDQISEILVVSPPLEKRLSVRTKSKTLIIRFNESLKDSSTYSLDFKNSIVDNNEKNPLRNVRFSFSTGDVYDSLRVAGRVVNSFNMEPVENALLLLHKNLHDSTVYRERPDFIAKTDEYGIFLIDNIPPGKYHLFALNDANSDLKYNEGAEEIAFYDSIIVPSAEFEAGLDTLVRGVDSLLVTGHTHFSPGPIYLRQFTEDLFEQYLDSYGRETAYKCNFIFNEPVGDTFNVRLLNEDADDWYMLEPNHKKDSLTLWVTDTLLAKQDTLLMEVSYIQFDTAQQLYLKHDTLEMKCTVSKDGAKDQKKGRANDKKPPAGKQRDGKKSDKGQNDENAPPPAIQFTWANSIASTVELNQKLRITSPEPLKKFDEGKVRLYLTGDTLKIPLKYKLEKDTSAWRTYNISFKWEPETDYTFEIDSAAAENIYGVTSLRLAKKFMTREEDYYGSIIVKASGVDSPVILQLLKSDDNETVLSEKKIESSQSVTFNFLAPNKYKLKAILDKNKNGKWDTGSYQDRYQPENVYYWNNIIKVRSNWDNSIDWDLSPKATYVKKIIDPELVEQKRKEAQEKAKREKKHNSGQQNNLLQN